MNKTVNFEEQIMSKDKYPSIFSKSNEGCVYQMKAVSIK